MGGLGPMAGQNHHFGQYVKNPTQLTATCGDKLLTVCSEAPRTQMKLVILIADMACYPGLFPTSASAEAPRL